MTEHRLPTALLQALSDLNKLLENQHFAAYWSEAVQLLHSMCPAQAVRLYWADEERGELDRVFQSAPISEGITGQIQQWETSLLRGTAHLLKREGASGAERVSYFSDPSGPGGVDLGMDGHYLVHLSLSQNNIPYGGLTFVCADLDVLPVDSPQLQELVALADLLTSTYVRAYALSTARYRLENANLLHQFNQTVSSLDLDQVLWDSAELAAYLLDAEASSIFLADADRQRLTFMVATGEIGRTLIGTHISISEGVAGWVTSHSQPLIVNHPESDPRFTGITDQLNGSRTKNVICVPLIVHNRTIGAMQVLNRQGGFRPQDLDWLASVSGQIAIAVENARLYSREHAKVNELASLNKVSQTITSELDVREVIGAITYSVLEILAVDRSELLLLNQQMQQFELYSATGAEIDSQWSQRPIPMDEGLVGLCAEQKHALIVNRVGDDPRCAGMFADPELAKSSLALVPLLSRGTTIGVIVVYSLLGHPFDEERMVLLQTFANQAAVALENATLYQSVQREQERIITIQEGVRHRLARDLHDGPAQMLSSIIMSIDLTRRHVQRDQDEAVLDELDRLEEIARQANREVRTLLFELRPIILESQGLVPAVHAYYRQLMGTLSSRIHLEVASFSETFSPLAADSIFAIIQESVNNIRKHAQAQNIWIRIYVEESNLFFEVEDDGVGLDLARLNEEYSRRNSYGLLNMRERAALFGGRLVIRSPRSPGKSGTVIVGTLPLRTILGEPNPDFSLF